MNKAQKKAQKRLKRKRIVEHKNQVKSQKKIMVRQRIKEIKATLAERMKNMVVLTPEQKAQYVIDAKKILKIPEDKEVTFEQIVQAMRMAKKRFEEQGINVSGEAEKTDEKGE